VKRMIRSTLSLAVLAVVAASWVAGGALASSARPVKARALCIPPQGGGQQICWRIIKTPCVCPGLFNKHCDPSGGPLKDCDEILEESCQGRLVPAGHGFHGLSVLVVSARQRASP
jgi:hypothetical protein